MGVFDEINKEHIISGTVTIESIKEAICAPARTLKPEIVIITNGMKERQIIELKSYINNKTSMKLFKKFLPKAEIRTYTGKLVDIFNLDPEQICIEDIAHSLAMQCRFSGHTREFYSVAQHCVMCSRICTETATFEALMHDTAEGYLTDVVSPLKKWLPIYRFLERRILKVLSNKFGFQYPFPPGVKEVDKYMLGYEWNSLMINDVTRLECWEPKRAEEEFLKAFYELWEPTQISS